MPYSISDLPFLLALPLLLIASGFISGSETALFGLSKHQRHEFAKRGGVIGQVVGQLLLDERMLLITLMLANMTINVLFFVISSMLQLKLLKQAANPVLIAAVTITPVIMLILFGEVLPKLIANSSRVKWVQVASVPLYTVHRIIGPLRVFIGYCIIAPLGRLVAPPTLPTGLTIEELGELLQMSQDRGVIGRDEELLLRGVVNLNQIKVRDVMVPRVDLKAIDINEPPSHLRKMIDETGLRRYVAFDGDLDHVRGVIYARQFLLASRLDRNVRLAELARAVRFVPELQRVDHLLHDFRKTGTTVAIAVDEYGGTAGLITLKDVVERLVGDLDMDAEPSDSPTTTVEQIETGRWRVNGRLSVRDWAETFGHEAIPPRISTVGGLVMALLGRAPKVGDKVYIGNLELKIETVDGRRIDSVLLELVERRGGDRDAGKAARATARSTEVSS